MTPLFKKLGLKEGSRAWVINYPATYLELFDRVPTGINWLNNSPKKKVDFVHLFISSYAELEKYYFKGCHAIAKDGMLWVSWPKGNKTIDINRDTIRKFGLDNGLVDVKVASINDYWSGLKFVYRLKDR